MPAMHKEVHEGTGEKHQDGQRCSDMCAMPDDQIAPDDNSDSEDEHSAIRSKTFEHSLSFLVVSGDHHTGYHVTFVDLRQIKAPILWLNRHNLYSRSAYHAYKHVIAIIEVVLHCSYRMYGD